MEVTKTQSSEGPEAPNNPSSVRAQSTGKPSREVSQGSVEWDRACLLQTLNKKGSLKTLQLRQ